MYNQIASNKRRSIILIVVFIALITIAGYGYGYAQGDPIGGLVLAGVISSLYALISFYKSDRIALLTSGAHLIEKGDHPTLWNTVETLAITSGLPMPRVAIIEDGAMNAFATGRNPEHAVVAVTRGLLTRLTKTELEGVIAHEMSHIKNWDIQLMTLVVVLVGTLAILGDLTRFGGGGNKRGGGWLAIVGIILLILSPLIGKLIQLAIGRQREYLADASGSLLTRYPEGLASALEKLKNDPLELKRATHATAHLFIKEPFKPSFLTRIFATHPPIDERIARLRKM